MHKKFQYGTALPSQTIGIDSEFCIVESLVTGIVDMFPGYLRPRRRQFTTCLCIVLFLLGAPMTMEGGAYLFQLMDFYREAGNHGIIICTVETWGEIHNAAK